MKKQILIVSIMVLVILCGILYCLSFLDSKMNSYAKDNKGSMTLSDNRVYVKNLIDKGYINISNPLIKNINIYSSYYTFSKNGKSIVDKCLYDKNKKYKERNNIKLTDAILKDNKDIFKPSDTYFFKGTNVNNYVWYNSNLWRIISFNRNEIKIISDLPITSIAWGNRKDYKNSYVSSWLNDYYYSKLKSTKLIKNSKYCIDKVNFLTSDMKCSEYIVQKVGLLNLNEYEQALIKGKSYLTEHNNAFYLANIDKNNNTVYYDPDTESLRFNDTNRSLSVRPVITINGNAKVVYGDGSLENYYVIENFNEKKEKLNKKAIGSYLVFSDKLWRIIDIDNMGNTKIKLENHGERKPFYAYDTNNEKLRCIGFDKIMNKDITGCTKYFESNQKNPPLFKKSNAYHAGGNNIAYYLNSLEDKDSFYNNLTSMKLIVKHEFLIGNYGINSNYKISPTEIVKEYIGLIRVGEMYSSNDNDFYYFTLTPFDKENHINYVNFNGELLHNYSSFPIGYRPVLYLKNNTISTSGNGTLDKPYTLLTK